MSTAAVFTWMVTVFVGLVLLCIWLIEYDPGSRSVAGPRLPTPMISTHALLGVGGLVTWGFYLLTDSDSLAWATVADLGAVAALGLIMVVRWVGVYRAYPAPANAPSSIAAVPAERHFPRPVIVIHGISAVLTIALVLYSVAFSGS